MNKTAKTILAACLALGLATPAMAEFKLNGYYRLMGYNSEVRSDAAANILTGTGNAAFTDNQADEEGESRQFIDQRLRLKATYTLNDNVAVVWFGEIDTIWGTAGGALGADNVNVETKNAYLDLKSGDTSAILGVQGIADSYQGVLYNDDMAGVSATHKIGNTTLNLVYAKLWEDNRSDDDDADLYSVGVKQKISDTVKLGADLFYMDINDAQNVYDTTVASYLPAAITGFQPNANPIPWNDQVAAEAWAIGVNADATFGNFNVNGFAIYEDLSVEFDRTAALFANAVYGDDNVDGSAWLATAKGTMKIDGGDVGLRVLYISPNDDSDAADQWIGNLGEYEFPGENLMQFMVDAYVCNYGKESYAWQDSVDQGYGLLAFVASGNHKLPSDMYLKWGAGYFLAADDEAKGSTGIYGDNNEFVGDTRGGGDTLGYELAVRFGKKYFEKVDVSVNASYAGYGDFYDNTARGVNNDPDSTYKTYLMLNVPF